MSEGQINQILKRLDEQDAENKRIHEAQNKQLTEISTKVTPMYTLFSKATGFNDVMIFLLKGLALVATVSAAVYAFFKWLKE